MKRAGIPKIKVICFCYTIAETKIETRMENIYCVKIRMALVTKAIVNLHTRIEKVADMSYAEKMLDCALGCVYAHSICCEQFRSKSPTGS